MANLNIRAREKTYSDLDFTFRRNPVTDAVSVKRDVEAVKQSIINILSTNRGERPFIPDFGANIRSYLFENFDGVTASLVEEQIRVALANYEPRVRVLDLSVEGLPDRNAMRIQLEFEILSPAPETGVVEFVVERLR
jgi:phage baseplate assembly protein W